jgi:amino acid transporter
MNLESLLQQVVDYGQRNMNVALAVVAVLLLLTIFKPKSMMKLYGACVLVLIGFYLLTLLGGVLSSGNKQKNQMIYKTREATGE